MQKLQRYLLDRSLTFWFVLFPLTFLLHVAEEYWMGGGYSAYLKQTHGIDFSENTFVISQAVGLVLLIAALIIAKRLRFIETMLVILGTVVAVNAISHIVSSVLQSGYGPGLITSILLWLPLGFATLLRFHATCKRSRYWVGMLIGLGINAAITLFTQSGGSL